jgi:hypothetical protein
VPIGSAKKSASFLKKEKQKTFVHMPWCRRKSAWRRSATKSLFASFSSEKEDSST